MISFVFFYNSVFCGYKKSDSMHNTQNVHILCCMCDAIKSAKGNALESCLDSYKPYLDLTLSK